MQNGPPSGIAVLPSPPIQSLSSSARRPPSSASPTQSLPSAQELDRNTNILIGISAMFFVLCTLAVIGRLLARKMVKVALEADDFVAILSWVLFTGLIAEQIITAYYIRTVFNSVNYTLKRSHRLLKLELAGQLTNALLITAVRISILLMYRRVFFPRERWFSIAWWSMMFIVSAYGIALFTVPLTGCSPHLWLDTRNCVQRRRTSKIGFKSPTILSFANAALDICILMLPIKILWSLQMTKQRKILVCGLFSLGLLGVVVSIARAISLLGLAANSNKSNSMVLISCWSTSEAAVALLCACLPMQRKLFGHLYHKLVSSRALRKISKTTSDKTVDRMWMRMRRQNEYTEC